MYRTSQFGGSYCSSVGVVTTLSGSMLAGTKVFFLSSVTSKWVWGKHNLQFNRWGGGAKHFQFMQGRNEVWVERFLLHPYTLTTALPFSLCIMHVTGLCTAQHSDAAVNFLEAITKQTLPSGYLISRPRTISWLSDTARHGSGSNPGRAEHWHVQCWNCTSTCSGEITWKQSAGFIVTYCCLMDVSTYLSHHQGELMEEKTCLKTLVCIANRMSS